MTCTAPILGCFILFCLLGVQAEEVPNQLNPIADNLSDSMRKTWLLFFSELHLLWWTKKVEGGLQKIEGG